MRRFTLAVGVACAILLLDHADAQNMAGASGSATMSTMSTSGGGSGGTSGGGGGSGMMPGDVVGSYKGQLFPVGERFPSVAPQVGQSIGGNSNSRQYDPSRPYDILKGTNLDSKNLIAPLLGADGKPVAPPDQLDLISERIKAFFARNPTPPRPPFAPGILRRSHARIKQAWRWD
jgi:hypothetical protein